MKNLLVKWGENPNLAKPTPKNPLVINGVMYNNRAEACSQLGIPKNLVRSLMRTKKWSQEKAILHCLSLPKEELGPVLRVTINGQTYPNLVEACKALGYVPDTLYATATKNGISSEKQLQKWVNEQYHLCDHLRADSYLAVPCKRLRHFGVWKIQRYLSALGKTNGSRHHARGDRRQVAAYLCRWRHARWHILSNFT